MDRNAHNWVGINCDGRTNVKASRRQIVIIFSAYNIETMAKRFKTIKKVDLEELRSGNRVRCTTIQSVTERQKLHVLEIIIYGFLILLLTTGTYWRNRVWNSELELWTDCVKKSPNKDRPHDNLGYAFFIQGKYQEAIDQYNEALRINPDFAEARYNLGTLFMNRGKYPEATNQYNEALRINPKSAEVHYNLGNVFLNQGKYQEAISYLNGALRIDPKFVEAHYNLGNAYLMIGNRGLALKEYEILKTMNRGLANALYQEIK